MKSITASAVAQTMMAIALVGIVVISLSNALTMANPFDQVRDNSVVENGLEVFPEPRLVYVVDCETGRITTVATAAVSIFRAEDNAACSGLFSTINSVDRRYQTSDKVVVSNRPLTVAEIRARS